MVKELEKQAQLQRYAILEGEEEKREAIRQLCYSLDHYKSGYRQLVRFLSGNKSNNRQQLSCDLDECSISPLLIPYTINMSSFVPYCVFSFVSDICQNL
ncbi:hypothetical protein Bca52824_095362 [Brassica carinata]|uniref:Uncharacterized protein n=1 Tax=Brassica carinata TaxID=52824 RepID=A0A8X7TIB1_BRACI|nr:hypothetical protein Bca52824_095362 [Brassica carinata]